MKLIIDGYNLIKMVSKAQHIAVDHRDQFLRQLGSYAKNKKLQIIVVFDGGDVSFVYSERIYGMEILYSGFQTSADDVIGRYITDRRGKEEMMVISSDREITNFAVSCGVDILGVVEFYSLVCAAEEAAILPKFTSQISKIGSNYDPELDELMEEGSRQIKFKKELNSSSRVASAKKLSKVERQKRRKLKKL